MRGEARNMLQPNLATVTCVDVHDNARLQENSRDSQFRRNLISIDFAHGP